MTDQELIESGELEAYVCGVLDDKESAALATRIRGNKLLKDEVDKIEYCYIKLAQGLAPNVDEDAIFNRLIELIGTTEPSKSGKSSIAPYLGWAAAIALLLLSGYLYSSLNETSSSNENLNEQVTSVEQEKEFLESEIDALQQDNQAFADAIAFIREPATVKVELAGQGDYASTRAVAFHNPEKELTYLDIKDLPQAPEGKTYQLWSLTFEPLTPTSLGVIEKEDRLLKIENAYASQGFGITLEPAGGSAAPNLDQLYTLGAIENKG